MGTTKVIPHTDFLQQRALTDSTIPFDTHANYGIIKEKSDDFGGEDGVDNYITRDTFDQFEKRIDNKFDNIEKQVASLPSNSDIKVMLLENNKELAKEAKQDRNTVIGWIIGFVGLGFTVAKAFGWL
ncbi:hypothetical protein ACWKSJ_02420 [Staphylococcus equorum]